jgi:hypothetical protein
MPKPLPPNFNEPIQSLLDRIAHATDGEMNLLARAALRINRPPMSECEILFIVQGRIGESGKPEIIENSISAPLPYRTVSRALLKALEGWAFHPLAYPPRDQFDRPRKDSPTMADEPRSDDDQDQTDYAMDLEKDWETSDTIADSIVHMLNAMVLSGALESLLCNGVLMAAAKYLTFVATAAGTRSLKESSITAILEQFEFLVRNAITAGEAGKRDDPNECPF